MNIEDVIEWIKIAEDDFDSAQRRLGILNLFVI
jgi:hypothetical protein